MLFTGAAFAVYLVFVILLAVPLGHYIEWVMRGGRLPLLSGLEQRLYGLLGLDRTEELTACGYLQRVLLFSLAGFLLLLLLLPAQGALPLNPQGAEGLSLPLALNTAVSFVTKTNWQAYRGELQLSYFTQAMGLTVQNFLSAGTGLAVCFAFLRGFTRKETGTIGSFFVDLVRAVLYVLLPLSAILALLLAAFGAVQSFAPYVLAQLTEPQGDVLQQLIPLGPAASQTAIQLLGTNGGGFFGANTAHPFVNPTPLTNFLEMTAILLLPAALCFSFGRAIRNRRQGRVIFAAMLTALVISLGGMFLAEQYGVPQLRQADFIAPMEARLPAGNLDGKDVRFGLADSALWTAITTASSNGSANSSLESYTPAGTMLALLNMQLGSVIFGGIGSGLYSMLAFVLLTVFITGLLVGRTPEFLGKKIGPQEMKLAVVICLAPTAAILGGCAFAAVWPGISGSLAAAGPHGFTELLYAYTSAGANNGSAMAGLQADQAVFHFSLALVMLIGRFVPLAAVLLLAGRMVQKPQAAASSGSLRTDTVLFGGLLLAVILLVGVLSFLPALALGPVAEFLRMAS